MINFQANLRKTGLRTLPAPSSAHQPKYLGAVEDSKHETMMIYVEKSDGASSATPSSTVPTVEPAYLDKDIGSEKTLLDLPSTPLKREVLPHNSFFLA